MPIEYGGQWIDSNKCEYYKMAIETGAQLFGTDDDDESVYTWDPY
jgi:hypothetical protein